MTQIRIDNVNYVHPCIQPIFRHIKLGFPTLNSLHLGFAYLKLGDLLPIVNLLFNPNRLQVLTITISKLSQSTTTDPEEFIHVFKASLSPTKLPLQTLTFAIRNYDDIPKPYMNALSNIVMRSLRVFRGLVNLHLSHPPAFNHPNEFLDLLHPCAQTLEKFECNDEYAMSLFTFLKTHEVTGSSMNLFGPLWATAPMNEFTALLLKAHATLPFLHVVLDPRVDAGVIIRGIGEGVEVNREVETLWVDAGGGWGMGGRDGFWDLLIKLIEKKLRGVRRLVVASEDRSVAEEHLKKFLELEIEVSFVC
ncbi:hypothetical protein BC829DRAFT_282430 [Chytridium lagenaria]|nr:hypothetical protein BC829DRAFT_282430 [Chytridium lagenaria]